MCQDMTIEAKDNNNKLYNKYEQLHSISNVEPFPDPKQFCLQTDVVANPVPYFVIPFFMKTFCL